MEITLEKPVPIATIAAEFAAVIFEDLRDEVDQTKWERTGPWIWENGAYSVTVTQKFTPTGRYLIAVLNGNGISKTYHVNLRPS